MVRAVVRDAEKGKAWADRGCEVAIASITDADGLTKAFSGVEGVFLMTPPDYDPEPGFPCTHEAVAAVQKAVAAARPGVLVFLSTIGAQVEEFSLLVGLALDTGFAGLALGIERVERKIEVMLGGFAGVDRAAQRSALGRLGFMVVPPLRRTPRLPSSRSGVR